ncbi:MAG TPA: ATP-binding protein [Mycobacteriales bacterium]|nr:ATP-binding protein [Mycobacteriales bacterium]
MTATQVVNLALGRAPEAVVPPEAVLEIDFPMLDPGGRLPARVVRWVPPSRLAGESQDIAGLQLDRPAPGDAAPLPMARVDHPFDRRVVLLGFPVGQHTGTYSVGRLRGTQAAGLARIDVEDAGGGLSGTPVWDVDAGVAVGMVIADPPGARMVPAATLFAAWPRLSEQARIASPFPGLRAFREQDAVSFFGRTELVDRLDALSRVAPVVTVLGPSGVGKSSLLHAGLMPALRTRTDTVVTVTRPAESASPLRSLALALDRAGPAAADPVARAERVTALEHLLRYGRIAEVVSAVLARAGAERLVLVVDQLEEVFAGARPDELTEFGAVLTSALNGGRSFAVVTALRADFLGEALRHPATAPLVDDPWLVSVAEPTRAELRELVTMPVERLHSVVFEAGLPDRLLGDLGIAAGRLPLLQFTLAALWDRERDGRLRHLAYDEIGRVDAAPGQHAEEVWSELSPAQCRAGERLLVQLIRPLPDGSGFIRRAALPSELDPEAWAIACRLATQRLLVLSETESAKGGPSFAVELGHESLVAHWSRLTELAVRNRDFRRWQETLRQRMRAWSDADRPVGKLPGRAELRTASRWTGEHADQMSPAERRFLARGRTRHRSMLVRTAVAVLVLILAVTYLVVARDRGAASRAANDLAAKAGAGHPAALRDPYGKVLFALRGYRTRHTDAADKAVESVGRATLVADAVLPDYSASPSYDLTGKVSADGRVMVATTADQKPAAFRIDGGSVGRILLDPMPLMSYRILAAAGARGTVAAFAGTTSGPLDPEAPRTPCAAPEPDRVQGCVTAYDLRTGRIVLEAPIWDPTLSAVTRLSVDGTDHVVGALTQGFDGVWRVLRWQVGSGRALPPVKIAGHWDDIPGFWLAPGGELATVLQVPPSSPNRRPGSVLSVLNMAGGQARVLNGAVHKATTVGASADGGRVASLVDSGPAPEVRVWDVTSGRVLAQVPVPREARSALDRGVALDPSGMVLGLTWLPDTETGAGRDRTSLARAMRDQGDTKVALFSVSEGRQIGTLQAPGGWPVVRPLGPSREAPVELSQGSLLALVLPTTAGGPAARLAAAPPQSLSPATAYAALCGKLLDRTESSEVTRARPDGAYAGDVCG